MFWEISYRQYVIDQCFSNFNEHTDYLEILLKNEDSESVGLEQSPRFYISDHLLDLAGTYRAYDPVADKLFFPPRRC